MQPIFSFIRENSLESRSPPLACALLPAVLAACPATPGETTATDPTATDPTGSTGGALSTTTSSTDPTSAPTTTADTDTQDTTTTQEPTTTTAGTETAGTATSVDTTSIDTSTTSDTTTSDTTTSGTATGDTTAADTSTSTSTGMPAECVPGDTQACYSGPDNTEGVGPCVAGERQCDRDGTWGPCAGEVVPAPETCDDPGDENCDGADPCLGDGAYNWGLTFGKGDADEGGRVAFDGAGNVVLAAWGKGALDFGGGPLQSAGHDVYLAKFSPSGQHLWSKRFGDAEYQGGPVYGLAVTPAGDIVLGGIFYGAIDFGGGPLKNPTLQTDLFLTKLNGNGAHVWSQSFHSGDDASVMDLAVAGNGDILLTGNFYNSLALGGAPLAAKGDFDIFVARYTSAGAHVWSRGIGDTVGQVGQTSTGVDLDAAGNAYLTGWFRGAMDPGNGPLVSAGLEDIFLLKLDPAGSTTWAKRFGDAGSQDARAVTVDSKDRVTLTGANSGAVDFGGGVLTGPQVLSYLVQFDGNGAHLWSRKLCTNASIAHDVSTDGLDNLLVTGDFQNMCDLGGAPLVSVDSRDVFVGKFSPKGQHGWSQRLSGSLDQFGVDIAGSAAGAVAVTGNFNININLGGIPKASQGVKDGYVVAFDP